jgi:L-2-hydroxyglutarate oxidase
MQKADLAIVGGGIVGLATAYQCLQRFPNWQVVLFEKEAAVAQHQTGHNSGVLHSGIYYRPGSLKAANCREGKLAMEAFCRDEGIPYEICGKIIVATSDEELPALQKIYDRGIANSVNCRLIERTEIVEREPHVAGIRGIYVPEAGIVDYAQVSKRVAEKITNHGAQIVLNCRVKKIVHSPQAEVIVTNDQEYQAARVINCTGLYSDRVAKASGAETTTKIVPFRGEYFCLKPAAEKYCKHLIYPVPDANFPFLGVHFTRMIDGGVECGPNAVLAFAREGYHKTDINLRDLAETLTYSGFWKLAAKYWQTGLGEMWRSLSKRAFVRALQRLVPEIQTTDLEPAPAGVRAQAIATDGSMVDDFAVIPSGNIIHVLNAPSPAATSSLNIAKLIINQLNP